MLYTYQKFCLASQLQEEIEISNIQTSLVSITTEGTNTNVLFSGTLNSSDVITLNTIVTNHTPNDTAIAQPQKVEISNTDIDDQGRQVTRIAAAKAGWSYLANTIEFKTAKVGSLFCQNYQGTNQTDVTLRLYDANNNEVLDVNNEASIVRTEVLFRPQHDYELISGHLHQIVQPSGNARVWVVGGIMELGGPYVKEFARGLNMKFIGPDEVLTTDGRASKYMKKDIVGVPFQANQIKVIIKHDAGLQHDLMLVFEYFRE